MKNNQQHFIEYVMHFAEENKCHIWLGGSFSTGTATEFSDVDISVFCSINVVQKLIYTYGKPVYISYTHRPLGILIIIYENGVAVDLEIIEKIDITEDQFFHTDDIHIHDYSGNKTACTTLALRNDTPYQVARLFHRSLIKYLSGKRALGVSIANEIEFDDTDINESDYKYRITDLLEKYNEKHRLPLEYCNILYELIDELK